MAKVVKKTTEEKKREASIKGEEPFCFDFFHMILLKRRYMSVDVSESERFSQQIPFNITWTVVIISENDKNMVLGVRMSIENVKNL